MNSLFVNPMKRWKEWSRKRKRERYRPPDFSDEDIRIIRSVEDYTMTGPERIFALIRAVEYVANNNIPGGIVECGVWIGGSMMAAIKVLQRLSATDRHIFLIDTFEGMSKPGNVDVSIDGCLAEEKYERMAM